MFVLEGSNNRTESQSGGAIFELGTGKPYYGALIAIAGTEGKSITIPLPQYSGDTVVINVSSLPLRRVDAIEIAGRRYVQTNGELRSGEFFWDVGREVILVRF